MEYFFQIFLIETTELELVEVDFEWYIAIYGNQFLRELQLFDICPEVIAAFAFDFVAMFQ